MQIGSAPAERVEYQFVEGGFFHVLGLQPRAGRLLSPEDDRIGEPRTRASSVGAAVMQVVQAGSADQVAEAAKVLEETRRSLYRMLDRYRITPPRREFGDGSEVVPFRPAPDEIGTEMSMQ